MGGPQNSALSERSPRLSPHAAPPSKETSRRQIHRQESRLVVARGWGEGTRTDFLMGLRFPLGLMKVF